MLKVNDLKSGDNMGPLLTELLEQTSKISDKHFQLIEVCKTILNEEMVSSEGFSEEVLASLPVGRNIMLALPITSINRDELKSLVLELSPFKTYEIAVYSKNNATTSKNLIRTLMLADGIPYDESIPKILNKYGEFLNHYRGE